MTVEDVKIPKRIFNMDPRDQNKPTQKDSAEYWETQAKAARAKREYLEEQKMSQHISEPEPPPEAPFKIKGEVNLGTIDYQEQQKTAAAAAETARKEAQDRIVKAEQERDDARKSLTEAQIAHMNIQLGGKIEQLQQAIAQNNRGGIEEQLAAIDKLANTLGYQKPVPGPTDSSLTLALKELEWRMKKEDREFTRQMKQDERVWQIEIRRLDQQAHEAEARLKSEKDKYAMFASAPERAGAVIAQAMMDKANSGGQAPITRQSRAPAGGQTYHAEANEGEVGEIPCPECQSPIGISPTARKAECINCHTKISINRIPTSSPESESEIKDGFTGIA